MAGVVFVFVREDASEAEMLARAFDEAGYSITGSDGAELSVVIWTRRARLSEAFRVAAERALRSGKAIVAALFAPPPREAVFGAPVIDLTRWDGFDTAALAPLLEAADDVVHPIEADVIVLPARPTYEDADFTEAPPMEAPLMIESRETARSAAARRSWEAPLPTHMLNPVRDEPLAEPKLGAPAPRKDFRRIAKRRSHAREHAALAFLVIAMLGGGAFVASVAVNATSSIQAERSQAGEGDGVSLTSANADAIGLEDIAPEPPPQIGRRGIEPPSAHTVHRARYEP